MQREPECTATSKAPSVGDVRVSVAINSTPLQSSPVAVLSGPVRSKRKWVIGILSAVAYEERRQACRLTWVRLAAAQPDVEVVFILGGTPNLHHTVRVNDVLLVPCPDDYASLPQKMHAFLRWAQDCFEFQFAFKCDDDTYVHFERLMGYEVRDRDYVGFDIGSYASGGAGYIVSSRAASALLLDLGRHKSGCEDAIVGDLLRQRGFALTGSGLFRPFFAPDSHPTQTNTIITGHHVSPEKMLELHAVLASPAPRVIRVPYRVMDWETGWGVLGLNGQLGHEVGGSTKVEPANVAMDWSPYEVISGHVNCRIEVLLDRPIGVFGFMDGHSWRVADSPVCFSIDGTAIGTLLGPDERTPERRLLPGRHVFEMCTPGDKTRRYPVWALRELVDRSSVRIVIPTSNRYVTNLRTTLALIRRYWYGHPPIDIVHHELCPPAENIRTFFAGAQAEVSWCEAMAKYLTEMNHDELLILLLDDYGLCQPVNTSLVANAIALMSEDLSLGAFYLTWMMLPKTEPYPERSDIVIWPRWTYSTHTQAAIWRRASLLRKLTRVGPCSIEAFELEASKIYNEYEFNWEKHISFRLPSPHSPSLFLDGCEKTHWPIGYHNLYHRGQPDPRHSRFLREHELTLE